MGLGVNRFDTAWGCRQGRADRSPGQVPAGMWTVQEGREHVAPAEDASARIDLRAPRRRHV